MVRDTAFLLGKRATRFSGLLASLGFCVRGIRTPDLSCDLNNPETFKDFPSGTEMDIIMIDEELGINMLGRVVTITVTRDYDRHELEGMLRRIIQERDALRKPLQDAIDRASAERNGMPVIWLLGEYAVRYGQYFKECGIGERCLNIDELDRKTMDKIRSCRYCKFIGREDYLLIDSKYVNVLLGGRKRTICVTGDVLFPEEMLEHLLCHLDIHQDSGGNLFCLKQTRK